MAVKVLTIIGTRPEAIKLFPVIHALEADPRFESRVCVTGQHREMVDQVLEMATVTSDHDLMATQGCQSLDALTALLLAGLGAVLDTEAAEWVVVQGDTTSALCGALAAYYRQIAVCHVEAGLRSGDIHHPWPEEGNRRIISAIASLHFAPTAASARALELENIPPSAVHVTGNTVIDALQWVVGRSKECPQMATKVAEIEARCSDKFIIGVTAHRRESFGAGMLMIADAIRQLASRNDVAIVFPLHPNPNVRNTMFAELGDIENVILLEPLDYPNFARLVSISHLMLTDSGGLQEEAPFLGTPVLVMRETTERPEGLEAGTAKLVGTNPDRIVAEVEKLLADADAYGRMARAHNPFGDGRAAERIVELLAGTLRSDQAAGSKMCPHMPMSV